MSVETRAQRATEGLRRSITLDVESGLARVRRTRRRRDLARVTVAAVVVAAAVGGVLSVRDRDAAPEPVGPVRNGEIVPPQQGERGWEDFDQPTGSFLYYAAPADNVYPPPAGVFTVVGKGGELAHLECPSGACDGFNALGPGSDEVSTVDRATWELHVLGYDGSTRETLNLRDAVAGEMLSDVAWSPDGTRLAVSTACGHVSAACPARVWIMDRDGGNSELVSSEPAPTSGIAWSPDGRRLAFSTDCDLPRAATCPARVWIVDRDGGIPRVVYSKPASPARVAGITLKPLIQALTWSPDGNTLAFIVHTNDCGAASDAGVRPRLLKLAERPTAAETLHVYDDIDCHGDLFPVHYPSHFHYAWSPDSTRLAVTSGGGFEEISAADGHILAQHPMYPAPGVDFVTGPLAWLRAP